MCFGIVVDLLLFACLAAITARAFRVSPRALAKLGGEPASERISSTQRATVVFLSSMLLYLVCAGLFAVAARLSVTRDTRVSPAPGFPAEAAGLREGDYVRAINGLPTRSFEEVLEAVAMHAPSKEPVEVVVARDRQPLTLRITPDESGRLGIISRGEAQHPELAEAALTGLRGPLDAIAITGSSLHQLVTGDLPFHEVGGPVALVRSASGTSHSFQALRMLSTLCSGALPMVYLLVGIAWLLSELRARANESAA